MFFHVGNCFQLQKNRTRPCIWAIKINEMVMCSIKQRGHRHWNPEGAGNTNLELYHMSALPLHHEDGRVTEAFGAIRL